MDLILFLPYTIKSSWTVLIFKYLSLNLSLLDSLSDSSDERKLKSSLIRFSILFFFVSYWHARVFEDNTFYLL